MMSPLLTPPPTTPHTRANSNDLCARALPSSHLKSPTPFLSTHIIEHHSVHFNLPTLNSICSVNEDHYAEDDGGMKKSPHQRAEKRRRTTTKQSQSRLAVNDNETAFPSPSKTAHSHQSYQGSAGSSGSPTSPPMPRGRKLPPTLAPIKPIGFAASRESRREDGVEQPIPSPVVMGFDFKAIDDEQLRTVGIVSRHINPSNGPMTSSGANSTQDDGQAKIPSLQQVRDTISIKEQQQALIAARRREVVASTPSTPKELTFKGWQPKDPNHAGIIVNPSSAVEKPQLSGGVGRRREKTRDKVEGLSILTGAAEKEMAAGSKVSGVIRRYATELIIEQSAPLNQGLAAQQASPRDPISGAQTSVPHILPPMQSYHHLADPRTAPLSDTRTRHSGDEREGLPPRDGRDDYARGQFWRPLPRPSGYENVPHTARPTISIPASDRRLYPGQSVSALHPPHNAPRDRQVSSSGLMTTSHNGPGERHVAHPGSRSGRNGQYSHSPSPPTYHSRAGDSFGQQQQQVHGGANAVVYELINQCEQVKYSLQETLSKCENLYGNQMSRMNEFKGTTQQAGQLLQNLQASSDSLREMVRYEIVKAKGGERKEVDELRERVRALEDVLRQGKE